jgi:hypothetical protein
MNTTTKQKQITRDPFCEFIVKYERDNHDVFQADTLIPFTAMREYLRNRLLHAFAAGWDAAHEFLKKNEVKPRTVRNDPQQSNKKSSAGTSPVAQGVEAAQDLPAQQ